MLPLLLVDTVIVGNDLLHSNWWVSVFQDCWISNWLRMWTSALIDFKLMSCVLRSVPLWMQSKLMNKVNGRANEKNNAIWRQPKWTNYGWKTRFRVRLLISSWIQLTFQLERSKNLVTGPTGTQWKTQWNTQTAMNCCQVSFLSAFLALVGRRQCQ